MSITEFLHWIYGFIEHPWVILLVFAAIPVIYLILRHEFVKLKEEPAAKKKRKRLERFVLFFRTLIILCLLIAIASPFSQTEKTIEGDPYISILVDNSNSMQLLEDVSKELQERLEKKINVETKVIGSGESSNIGDGILSNLKPHGSVLLVSDCNANTGASLGDVALFASKLNASISVVKPVVKNKDAFVSIVGPSKTMEDSDTSFDVIIGKVGDISSVPLVVDIDGETVYNKVADGPVTRITKKLAKGVHKITARINVNDYFSQNNVFYKTIKVVPQPKIFLFSEKATPLLQLFRQVYEVDTAGDLPASLKDYYAIVINDLPASKLDPISDVLNEFVADGNGLVVVGGENSYENGNYKGSLFESILPVTVGEAEKKKGDTIIAIVIDISGSTGTPFGRFKSTADFSKAATIGIIRGLKPETRLAIVAFNSQAYLVSEPSMVFEKKGIENVIARLRWGGSTAASAGIMKAVQVISNFAGSKNIVFLSDGRPQNEAAALEAAKYAANLGIKIYSVGVGPTTNEQFMMDLAEITNGIYFRATEESKLNIIFGPVDEEKAKSSTMDLVVLNSNHFITQNLDPEAAVYGFNQVVPKNAARMLITTITGEPILNVWRLGLGRIASVATDDGSNWGSELLNKKNSKFWIRIVNWAIGDPERKSQAFIDAKDTRLGLPTEITVKSSVQPSAKGITFYKVDEDLYSGSVTPSDSGFQSVARAVFAVNYPLEYEMIGINPAMEIITQATGGKVFDKNDIQGMIDFAKTKATRTISTRKYHRLPFVVAAIVLFLIEIFIRRIARKE